MADETMDIGNDAMLQFLLGGMTSSSPSVNLGVLGSLLTGDSVGLPLSVLLGTSNIGDLASIVNNSQYGTQVGADVLQAMDYSQTEAQFAGDPEISLALEAVKAGIPPETYVMQQKAEVAAMEDLSDAQRTSENFRLDALKPVLDVYRNQLDAYTAFQGKVANGEIVDRDGTFFNAMSDADRRAALEAQGVTGALANPSMYVSPLQRSLQEAQNFQSSAQQAENTQAQKASFDQLVDRTRITDAQNNQIEQLVKRSQRQPETTLPEDPSFWQRFAGWFNGQTRDNPTADSTVLAGAAGGPVNVPNRPKIDPDEIAARAGMYYGNKNAYEAQVQRKQAQSDLDTMQLDNARRYSEMLKAAEGQSSRTPAEDYIATQSSLLSALARGSGGGGGGGGGTYRPPKITLDQQTIDSIISSIAR